MGLLERTKVVVCRHAPSPSPQSAPLAALAALFSPKSQRLQSHAITCNPSGQHRKSASPDKSAVLLWCTIGQKKFRLYDKASPYISGGARPLHSPYSDLWGLACGAMELAC